MQNTAKLLLVMLFLITSCSFNNTPDLKLDHSALQLRQFQKKEFNGVNKIAVMRAVVASCQDLGFTVKNSTPELGIIVAEMQISASSSTTQYLQSWWYKETTIASIKHIDATINVEEIGKGKVIVRSSFVAKALNKMGGTIKAEPIISPEFYQDFFSRIDKAIFLKHNLL